MKNVSINMNLSMGRDESYGFFHSIGKVLYAKRDQTVDEILQRTSTESSTLLLDFLQQNHLSFFIMENDHHDKDDHCQEDDMNVWESCEWMSLGDQLSEQTKILNLGEVSFFF